MELITIMREFPFFLYKDEKGNEAMAGQLIAEETLHLADGPKTFKVGDYEVITPSGPASYGCVYMEKEEFEKRYKLAETEPEVKKEEKKEVIK